MNPLPLITLHDVTIRLGDRWLLAGTNWQIGQGEHWVVWGANGAGKTSLANALMGSAAVVRGQIRRHYLDDPALCGDRPPMALFSPEHYHRLYQQEQLLAQMRHFSGRTGEISRVATWWNAAVGASTAPISAARQRRMVERFDLGPLLDKPLEGLSTGEMRKLLLARTLLPDPLLLILDEPFNGLDAASRDHFSALLSQLARNGTQMVLITHRIREIAGFFTHVLHLDQGRVVWQGPRAAFLGRIPAPAGARGGPAPVIGADADRPAADPLIFMQAVSVRFGDQSVLDRIDWTVRPGENWALTGPNGAGKSTLLALITGDQLQAYANRITLFGRPRGSGESVWEVKQHIGFVGDPLQARYQRSVTGFDVVCSGFFDSVGLYRRCTPDQRQVARQWVQTLALGDLADRPMVQLSFGQQRLMLIARAMVKSPRLLILDEPCNGLDRAHRLRLLGLLDTVGRSGATNLIYVSHRRDELPACITHRLWLERGRVAGVERVSPGP